MKKEFKNNSCCHATSARLSVVILTVNLKKNIYIYLLASTRFFNIEHTEQLHPVCCYCVVCVTAASLAWLQWLEGLVGH